MAYGSPGWNVNGEQGNNNDNSAKFWIWRVIYSTTHGFWNVGCIISGDNCLVVK
jgi:hypothetical protein